MFSDMLKKAEEDLKILIGDIEKIDQSNEGEDISKKSLEPLTRMRNSIEEAKEAQAMNPHVLFVHDKISDILGE